MELDYRQATIEDLDLLMHWDRQEHVIASDPDDDWQWEHELNHHPSWREQWISMREEEAIGFLQIIDPLEEPSRYWGEVPPNWRAIDIWIGEAHNLSKAYGKQMLRWAIDRCFSNPAVEGILIDPLKTNSRAINFYKREGFEFLEDRILGNSICAVHQMLRPQH